MSKTQGVHAHRLGARRLVWLTVATTLTTAGGWSRSAQRPVPRGGSGGPVVSAVDAVDPVDVQPVQEYFVPFTDCLVTPTVGDLQSFNSFRCYTHLGTDYGYVGEGASALAWEPGQVKVDLPPDRWAGMWHSLAGLADEADRTLDFQAVYPEWILPAFQPRCTHVLVRAGGRGRLKVEIRDVHQNVLWERTETLDSGPTLRDLLLEVPADDIADAKFLNWTAEEGSVLTVDALSLQLEYPPMTIAQRVFLVAYAKLSHCFAPETGLVRDRANIPAGEFDSVPASGMFALATAAARDLGMVADGFAEQTVRQVQQAVGDLPQAYGLLPHFVSRPQLGIGHGDFRIHPGTEYSTVDTSIAYHSLLLAATMTGDTLTLDRLTAAIGSIDFAALRDSQGYVLHGVEADGLTLLPFRWSDWGGETALVLLLQGMADPDLKPMMDKDGEIHSGIGFIAEIQSLFYPQFDSEEPDAVSGQNWAAVRRWLLTDQMSYGVREWPDAAAAGLGIYGLSAGEAKRGQGYAVNGTRYRGVRLLHPHYVLMSAADRGDTDGTYRLLERMHERSLLPPWGMVENVTAKLDEYLPMIGSLNASFESLSAYHLLARHAGTPDAIYRASRDNPLTSRAIAAFYPDAANEPPPAP